MKTLQQIFHLGLKELRSLAGDPVMVVLIVYSFSLAVFSGSKSITSELRNASIAMVDEDRSPLTERIAGAFYKPYFKPPALISLHEVDPAMDAGRFTFVLNLPPNFERDVVAGRQPLIQLNIDATQMSQAFTGAGYIQSIVLSETRAFLERFRSEPAEPVTLALNYKFNPTLETSWFGAIVELINQITMLAVILTGAALIRERERGTLEHLLVMPLSPFDIMISKVWANALVVLVATALSLKGVIQGALAMPIAGSVPLFLFGVTVYLFSATSLGIFLGTVSRTMPQMGLLLILVILPLQMLSGGSTPFESMPTAIQQIMLFSPTTHIVKFAQAILCRGAGWEVVWPNFLATLAIGAVLFSVSLALFRKSLSSST